MEGDLHRKSRPISRVLSIWLDMGGRLILYWSITLLVLASTNIQQKTNLLISVIMFTIVNVSIGLLSARRLPRARTRLSYPITEVILISLIVYYTRDASDSWFLLYTFPIASVSRRLWYKGSLIVATMVILSYVTVATLASPTGTAELQTVLLRCAFFLSVAFLARNFALGGEREASRLIKNFEEINNAILSDLGADKTFRLILHQALEMTESETGHIRLADATTQAGDFKMVAAVGHTPDHEWSLKSLNESFSREVILSKRPLLVPSIGRRDLRERLGTYFLFHRPRPKSAIFVPVCIKHEAIGVIAVYSRNPFHYTERDLQRLLTFGLLVAIAQTNAHLYQELSVTATEKQGRLELLHQIGARLTAGTSLSDLFGAVVELTYNQLNSEEAALFILESSNKNCINKVAVKGPNDQVSLKAGDLETSYLVNQGLVGHVFQQKSPVILNEGSEDIQYISDYVRILPSKRVNHFLGVPLFIGNEVFGVLRVTNKKSAQYSPESGNYTLLDEGFSSDDVTLLQTIASQIAVAIKNSQLLESEKLSVLGRLAHSVGHDIKTDIATALNYIEVLSLGSNLDYPNCREMYKEIEVSLSHAIDKMQTLLMVSRPKPPQKELAHVATLLEGLREQEALRASTQNINFTVDLPAVECTLVADVDQIRQVFSNLFSNSIYAIELLRLANPVRKLGRIRVWAEVCDGKLKIVWEDDGCGIPQHHVAKVFKAFFTTKESGNGLGLYLAKTIVDNHGGSISVASLECEGTRFEITLPLWRDDF
jgi:signal transduction histidine kinase